MGFSSSSVEKRGSDDTVDSESCIKKTRIQEVMIAQIQTEIAVSYTHLTLPTKRIV